MKTQKKNIIQSPSAVLSLLVIAALFSFPNFLFAQSAPSIEWQKCLGGTMSDNAASIIQTFDGGYALVGWTTSMDGDIIGTHTDTIGTRGYVTADIWFVKLSSSGSIQWQKCLGGKGEDRPNSVIQTADSGFIIVGDTRSTDGDVFGLHIDTTVNKHLHDDAWIVKLSSKGNIDWKKCIGGSDEDDAYSIIETLDGGYAVCGWASSVDGDLSFSHVGQFWVLKLNHAGSIEWNKCLGGANGQETALSIIQTSDSGYALTGAATSSNGDVSGHHGLPGIYGSFGASDVWVVKLSSLGNIQWEKCFGGTGDDWANSIIATSDRGYILAGYTTSNDGDVKGHHPPDTTFREADTIITGKNNSDAWIIKLDSSGNIQWQKCFGGHGNELARSIIQTSNGGYIFLGNTTSTDGDVSGLHGVQSDGWLVQLSSSGNILWQKCLGGTGEDAVYSLIKTADGGFAVAGFTSSNDGDVLGNHGKFGYSDAWVVKLSAPSAVPENSSSMNSSLNLITYPNPAAKKITLDYDLLKPSAVKITIYNITGEQLKNINIKEEESGHHEISFDLGSFPIGSYFMKVEASGITETVALEVVR